MSLSTAIADAASPAARAVDADAGLRDLEALELSCLGGGLGEAARAALESAGACYHEEKVAEDLLLRAYALAPEHPATHIALYRFYFYRNRLREALPVGLRCLAFAARLNGLAQDWRLVHAGDLASEGWQLLPRFYLFTLKACAYLSLRLDEHEQGAALLRKLQELDAQDRLGGSVLRQVLERHGRDDEDD